jgi:hypothetical protein
MRRVVGCLAVYTLAVYGSLAFTATAFRPVMYLRWWSEHSSLLARSRRSEGARLDAEARAITLAPRWLACESSGS